MGGGKAEESISKTRIKKSDKITAKPKETRQQEKWKLGAYLLMLAANAAHEIYQRYI